MSAGESAGLLLRYTAWADDRLYESLAALGEAVINQPRPGRADGIRGVLVHILAVGLIWKAHLGGYRHGLTTRNLEPLPDFQALRSRQQQLDCWYVAFAQDLSAQHADVPMDFDFVDGSTGRMTARQMLLHVANHGTYHRGYVAGMLYDAGLRPPTMDLPVFIREQRMAPR